MECEGSLYTPPKIYGLPLMIDFTSALFSSGLYEENKKPFVVVV